MWNIFFICTILVTLQLPVHGDVSHIVGQQGHHEHHHDHPGYGKHKPDQPLELPGGSNVNTAHAGYPKEVPKNPLLIDSSTTVDLQNQYIPPPPPSDSLTAGSNGSSVVTSVQKHHDDDHHHHYHGEDGKYNPHDDGRGWDIRKSVPGEPGVDYPTLESVPRTSFTCSEKAPGYYADKEARCQVFRVCTTRSSNAFTSFLCPNGSLFNQAVLTCDWWNNVDCENSEQYYYKNNEIGKMPEGPQLMYEINKMLQAPMNTIPQYYNKIEADNQIQGTIQETQGIYLPPKHVTTTEKHYYTPTVPTTTHKQFVPQIHQNTNKYQFQHTQQGSQHNLAGYDYKKPSPTFQQSQNFNKNQYQTSQQSFASSTPSINQIDTSKVHQESQGEKKHYQLTHSVHSTQEAIQPQPIAGLTNIYQTSGQGPKPTNGPPKSVNNIQVGVNIPSSVSHSQDNQIQVVKTTSSKPVVITSSKPIQTTSKPIETTPKLHVSTSTKPPKLFVSQTAKPTPQALYVSEEHKKTNEDKPLFTSPFVSQVHTSDNEDNKLFISPFISHKTETKDAQPLFVSKDSTEQMNTLFISPFVSKSSDTHNNTITSTKFVPKAPKAPKVTLDSQISNQLLSSQIGQTGQTQQATQKPLVSITKESTKTITENEKTTHTFHDSNGPQKISLLDQNAGNTVSTASKLPVAPSTQKAISQTQFGSSQQQFNQNQQQASLNKFNTQQGAVQQQFGSQQQSGIQQQQTNIPSFNTQQASLNKFNTQLSPVQLQFDSQQQSGVQQQQQTSIPSFNTQQNTIQQQVGVKQEYGVPQQKPIQTSQVTTQLSKDEAIEAINKLQTNLQTLLNKNKGVDSGTSGKGVIDIRVNENSAILADNFGEQHKTLQGFQGQSNFAQTQGQTNFGQTQGLANFGQTQGQANFGQANFGQTQGQANIGQTNVGLTQGQLNFGQTQGQFNFGQTQGYSGFAQQPNINTFQTQEFTGYNYPNIPVQGIPNIQQNFHRFNYHQKNTQNHYEVSKEGSAHNYNGQSISHHPNGGQTHSTFNGQNVAYKETTKVEIIPAIGFDLSDNVGKNSFQSAVLSGLFQDRNYEASPTENTYTSGFHPSDVRYSSYQGPSSYLVPQKSVLQLPSDSGYHR